MNQLTCEMCGGTDLIKQDGVFVCQNCGMKYSVEEAKKMMIEGTVEVQGTVKVDNSSFVEKYLANAHRAKQKEDWEETEKYYNMVEQNDPTNIEAIFYSAYAKARVSLVDSDLPKRKAAFNVLKKCVSIIDDNFNMEKEEEQKNIIKQISDDIISICGASYTYNQTKNGYGNVTGSDSNATIFLFRGLNDEFCITIEEIIKKYPEKDPRNVYFYELVILHKTKNLRMEQELPALIRSSVFVNNYKDTILKYHKLWHEIDASHAVPSAEELKKKKGCYVATAVYGSYDCPQVWTLRRYRDYTLAKTWRGRTFIHTYYAISPTLVKWFGHTKWFKKMWQGKLDRMVKKLNDEGVKNTPYEDIEW